MSETPKTRIVGSPTQVKTWTAKDPQGKPSGVIEFHVPGYQIEVQFGAKDLGPFREVINSLADKIAAKVN